MTTGQILPASPIEPVLSLRDLRVSYGEREILHGISFDVVHGETLVILLRRRNGRDAKENRHVLPGRSLVRFDDRG